MGSQPGSDPGLSAAGCLALLWPLLPETLVAPATRRALEGVAATLPPVPAVAIELRLDDADDAVDLHQVIDARVRHLLPAYLAAHPPRSPAEARLHGFLADWADDRVIGVPEIYLEWDRPADPAAEPAPGLFVALDTADGEDRAAPLGLADGTVGAAVERVRRALPEGATINFLGFMLGRDDALRVNLRRVRPDELAPLLTAIGWPGDIAAAARELAGWVPLCDRVMVALDFTPELQPTLGFELFLHGGPASETRHAALFDRMEARGLCSAARREALAAIDAQLLPEADGQPWPAAWLMATAARPHRDVPLARVRLSHLKLSLDRHGAASAKAYVSARHHWSPADTVPAPAPSGRSPAQARAAALAFLLGEQGQDDRWRDFAIFNGPSDQWVTAFVGRALATTAEPRALRAATRARDALLRGRDPAAGWGYSGASQPDSDSSAWVIRLLRALDPDDHRAGAIESFLGRHLLAEGGFTTYAPSTPLRSSDGDSTAAGWRAHHGCVTANAAIAATGALRSTLHALLRATQRPEGRWRAYWWRTDVFATALAIEALVQPGAAPDPALRRALDWLRAQEAGTVFDLTCQAAALWHGDAADRAAGRALADRLVEEQRADGSWPGDAEMLLPNPACIEPLPDEPIYPDVRRVFTTASALVALERWK